MIQHAFRFNYSFFIDKLDFFGTRQSQTAEK